MGCIAESRAACHHALPRREDESDTANLNPPRCDNTFASLRAVRTQDCGWRSDLAQDMRGTHLPIVLTREEVMENLRVLRD